MPSQVPSPHDLLPQILCSIKDGARIYFCGESKIMDHSLLWAVLMSYSWLYTQQLLLVEYWEPYMASKDQTWSAAWNPSVLTPVLFLQAQAGRHIFKAL